MYIISVSEVRVHSPALMAVEVLRMDHLELVHDVLSLNGEATLTTELL